jgi:hypothetical protein
LLIDLLSGKFSLLVGAFGVPHDGQYMDNVLTVMDAVEMANCAELDKTIAGGSQKWLSLWGEAR